MRLDTPVPPTPATVPVRPGVASSGHVQAGHRTDLRNRFRIQSRGHRADPAREEEFSCGPLVTAGRDPLCDGTQTTVAGRGDGRRTCGDHPSQRTQSARGVQQSRDLRDVGTDPPGGQFSRHQLDTPAVHAPQQADPQLLISRADVSHLLGW